MTVTARDIIESPPGALISGHDLDKLQARPHWHTIAPPEAVVTAWADLTGTIVQLQDLDDEWAAVGVSDAAALNDYQRAYAESVEKDTKPPKPPQLTDPHTEQQRIKAEFRALMAFASRRRRTYDRAVTDALPAWRQEVLDGIDPEATLAAARKALFDLQATVSRHNGTAATVRAMNQAIDPDWGNVPTGKSRFAELRIQLADGLNAVSAYLGSSDQSVTGEDLADPVGIKPPMSVRRWMASHSPDWRRQLRAVEEAENFAITDYTRHDNAAGIPAGHTR